MSETEKPKSWRDVIPIHQAADMFPMMSPDELKALGEDIKQHGMSSPIVWWCEKEADIGKTPPPQYYLLEGRNRLDAMEAVGIKVIDFSGKEPVFHPMVWEEVRYGEGVPLKNAMTGKTSIEKTDPFAFVLSANLYRRHLTAEQKREIVAKLLKVQPEKSNRIIAKQIQVDDKTVGSVRRELEGRSEIPHVSTVEDTKGRQQPTHKKAKQQEKAERRATREVELAARIIALPSKKYGVIYADPPWRFEPYSRDTGMDRAADNHYPTSTTDEIAALPVPAIAADHAVCFLWATAPMIDDALAVMRAWGFEYKSQVVWDKEIAGTGYWFRNQHELLLVGTRGKVPAPAEGTQWPSVIRALRGAHSEKPERALELIEAYFPTLPKIELYGRGEARLGWEAWGNEVPLPMPVPDTELRYVPHEAVEQFAAAGWTATEGLEGTHHGDRTTD